MLQIAREQKTRALEVLVLSKTKEVQNLEDFGSRKLPKSSVEHLYTDQRLTNACQFAKGTAMYLRLCSQNSKLPVADTKLRGGKFLPVVSSPRV